MVPRVQFGIAKVCPVDAPVQIGRRQSTPQMPGDVYVGLVCKLRERRREKGRGGWREKKRGSVCAESFSQNSVGWFVTSIRSADADETRIATNSVRAGGCGLCHFWGRDRPGPRSGPTPHRPPLNAKTHPKSGRLRRSGHTLTSGSTTNI